MICGCERWRWERRQEVERKEKGRGGVVRGPRGRDGRPNREMPQGGLGRDEGQTAPLGSQLSSLLFNAGNVGKQRIAHVVNLVSSLWVLHLMAAATSDDEATLVAVASFQPLERWESQVQKTACLFKFQAVEMRPRWKMRGDRGSRLKCMREHERA